MSTSKTQAIADAVVTSLNDATLSQSFTVTRVWYVKPKLEDLASLTVYVVPAPWREQPAGRRKTAVERVVDVICLKQCDPTDNDDVDPLVYLLEELLDHFLAKSVTDANSTKWTCSGGIDGTGRQPLNPEEAAIDGELFNEGRVFCNVIRTAWQCRTPSGG